MIKSTAVTVIGARCRLALLASAAAALFLLLAACGSGGGSATETPGAAQVTPSAVGSESTQVPAAPAATSTSGESEPTTVPAATVATSTSGGSEPTTVPAATSTSGGSGPATVPGAAVATSTAGGSGATPAAPAEATATPSTAPAPEPTADEDADTPQAGVPTAEPVATEPPPPDTPTPGPPRDVGGRVGNLAPEFYGITAWINSDPLTMEALRGKVVLIDFWTYTCINCIRTYPYLKLWNSRYSDDGLVIVGVHAPEFEFEKDYDNVVEAATNDGIVWPIAQDNDFDTWHSYSNRYWPAKYLIDKDGVIRYTHFGEGGYAETEELIRELLLDTGVTLNDENLPLPEDQRLDPTFQNTRGADYTRELYAGYRRGINDLQYGRGGYVGQPEYYESIDTMFDFQAPEEFAPNLIYLQGPWHIGRESSRHAVDAPDFDDYLGLVYSARTVNAVLTSDSGVPYKVRLTVDGEYLTEENKGQDVIIGDDGESYLWVTEPKMYSIVENPTWETGEELRMSSDSRDFGLFAFTFGVYEKEQS